MEDFLYVMAGAALIFLFIVILFALAGWLVILLIEEIIGMVKDFKEK